MADKKPKNPWTTEDECEHFPSVLEWWCGISFFETIEDKKKWCFKCTFTQWSEKTGIGSIFHSTLVDQDKDKQYPHYSRNEKDKLKSSKNELQISYDDSFVRGSYPNYEIYCHDNENDIILDLKYHSDVLPHWIAQDLTNGYLPMGLGTFRYGFIPKNHITGSIKIKGKNFKIKGQGYFEHVWGDFFYNNPISSIGELRKSMPTYTKLIGWWLHNHRIKIPDSLTFTSENNPFGYDWAWALFDNGWTLFYGNIMLWLMEGPAAGILVFSKDGKHYSEFSNINFKYNNIRRSDIYDFIYPSEMEITAKNGKEKLHLIFKMTTQTREYVSRFPQAKFWKGFVICESSGVVNGYYQDGDKKTKLSGLCKLEPQRQISVLGHNQLKVDFIKPPKGVGISLDLDSHFLKKKISVKLQLTPSFKLKFRSDKT